MAHDASTPVAVSRRIAASAHDIFRLLADPGRHPEFDGSGTVRAGASNAVVSGVGDVFVMKMHDAALGDDAMNNLVVEYEVDRRVGWELAPGNGHPAADAQDPVGNRGTVRGTGRSSISASHPYASTVGMSLLNGSCTHLMKRGKTKLATIGRNIVMGVTLGADRRHQAYTNHTSANNTDGCGRRLFGERTGDLFRRQ